MRRTRQRLSGVGWTRTADVRYNAGPMVLGIARLKHAITTQHHCRAEQASSKIIVARRPDGTVRRGTVDVFDISGHPEATRAYGWFEDESPIAGCRTMLQILPITSAQLAVRAALAEAR